MTRPPTSRRQRLSDAWTLLQFAWHTLIAPWPPFALFLVVIGVVGGLMPLGRITAITHLIDTLTAQTGGPSSPASEPLGPLLAPYLPWLLLLVGMVILDRTIYYQPFHMYLAAQLNERVKERFDRLFFGKTLALGLEQFENPTYYDMLRRAREALDDDVASRLGQVQALVAMLPSCAVILGALAAVHWALPLLVLGGSVPLIHVHIRRAQRVVAATHAQTTLQRRQAYWRSLLIQREAAAEVRLFGLSEHIVAAWHGVTDELLDEITGVRHRRVRRDAGIALATVGLNCGVLLALILAARAGRLSSGALVALLFAMQLYLDQVDRIGSRLGMLQLFIGRLRYAAAFLALEGEERQHGLPAPPVGGDGIRCVEVGFTYPGSSRPALAGIDLHIQPGERIALVGENGAGKSTLARLLLGLYRPTEGHIMVDGIDLQMIAPQAWRARASAVLQDYARYAVTARENIGFGRLEQLNDFQAITSAARQSGAAEVIERLPARYETLLGKEFAGGVDLSGGEWQKLAIARAYLHDGSLLVLDEPASALDALAEREVYRQFLSLSAGKTVLLISHRLGSAQLADRIVFLHNGRIMELGTHAELMANGGLYAALYAMQAEWYRDQPEPDAPDKRGRTENVRWAKP